MENSIVWKNYGV